MKSKIASIVLVFGWASTAWAQAPCGEIDGERVSRLQEDIYFLASDQLEGREPGTAGAEAAIEYIEVEFRKAGLNPYFTDGGYRQKFPIAMRVTFDKDNRLVLNEDTLKVGKDYYPTSYSANGLASGELLYVKYGITAPEMKYDDYKRIKPKHAEGSIFVMDVSSPDGIHPHSEYLKYHDLGERISAAKAKGAVGVVLVNLEGSANDIDPNFRKIHSSGIPVVFVTNNELAKNFTKKGEAKFVTRLQENYVDGFNIAGFKDNKAERTVVIGAHYDHLGLGGNGSLSTEKAIHNGADDNASGTAALMEIARFIKTAEEDYKKFNYLFVAFSGEELGLLGSKFFTGKMEDLRIGKIAFMLNMDMVGRLEEGALAVNGVGTSPIWNEVLEESRCDEIVIKSSKSGVGPSDHTSFYYLDIPVLHFFTGTHSDYHKPSDDADKINYEGEAVVISYILNVIQNASHYDGMPFTKTVEQSKMAPKFSVTLGVMPDYMYEGEGMRIDGVSLDKPAANAGLQKGDIVTHLGDVKVVDMMSYMKALGQFKKGDTAKIEYIRGGKSQKAEVKF
ncbi:putative aminopeptidase [Owenweeksia hongkongensis DSM 17368]|uniref:Putative aminopeptidase n=1 Tax=Owenweeksia hongkongensis (strain DSM 17368 / CIP 108786 / JCM 12287 / NRRL B-23963 / UST20020801) TaxID=926562 RepID=G8R8C2_OWEHD|nr:M28 family peptidase [Owenweeksia hongkongensis]AEV33515.1 putative aminopeptidase [Owenweeksia hongkongensis DSM 17368]